MFHANLAIMITLFFWDAVKKYNRNECVLPQKMGNISGEKDICNEWKEHFSSVYNSVPESSDNVFHNIKINRFLFNTDVLFTEAQLVIAVLKLVEK